MRDINDDIVLDGGIVQIGIPEFFIQKNSTGILNSQDQRGIDKDGPLLQTQIK